MWTALFARQTHDATFPLQDWAIGGQGPKVLCVGMAAGDSLAEGWMHGIFGRVAVALFRCHLA